MKFDFQKYCSDIRYFLSRETKVANQRWYVWLIFGITVFGFLGLGITNWNTSVKVDNVQAELSDLNPANQLIKKYFSLIEQGNYDSAWNLFSEKKKMSQEGWLNGFKDWLKYFVAFEGLNIKEIKEKSGASTKVYIAEFDFKQRGMKPVHSIWGMYVKYNGEKWQIDYSNVFYENGWKKGACDFYSGFDICKK